MRGRRRYRDMITAAGRCGRRSCGWVWLKSGRAVKVPGCHQHSEVVVFDDDGDDGPGMGSSDSQSLRGDHHDTIFGTRRFTPRGPAGGGEGSADFAGRGTPYQSNLIQRERVL
jgi:hypothetical protein